MHHVGFAALGLASMKNAFRSLIVFIAVQFLLALPPSVFPDEGSQEVVAAALRNWPPHYLTDSKTGIPDGFAIDVMNKVAQISNLNVRYILYSDWPEAFEALRTKKAVLVPNLGITDERLGLYDFTEPYETFRISIFVRSATDDIRDVGALIGKKVGVVEKNQGHVLMKAAGQSDLHVFKSMEEAFMALLSGSIDALVYPENPIKNIAMQSGLETKIRVVGKPLQEIKRAIAVIKGQPELFNKVDSAIRQFTKTNEYQTIYQKWHGKPQAFWTVSRVVLVMGIVFGVTVACMLTWRYLSIVRLNRSLSEAEERFRGIVEKSNAGYFLIDQEGRFQAVNDAWLKMHGYDCREDVIGKNFSLTQVQSDIKLAQKNVATLLVGQSIPSGTFTRKCKDGSVGYHTFSAHPAVQAGRVIGVEGFIIDTTDLNRVEAQKHALETRLWQAKKAESLARMAGAIAHNFNNQLSVVAGNLELALDSLPEDDAIREFLIESLQAARRSAEISGLMLTYLGQGTGGGEPLDLSEACRKHLLMIHQDVPNAIEIESDLVSPGPIVKALSSNIRQVLTHLITNAVEAIGDRDGKIVISTSTICASDVAKFQLTPADWQPTAETYACIEVSDTGCGMATDDMDKLFDPFFTTKFTGRGLGLAVVLGIVRAMEGAIDVQSKKGNGSTFKIYLPLAQGSPSIRAESERVVQQNAKSGTVLLVDDQDAVRRMVEKMLNRLDYAVVTASTGVEAVELLIHHRDAISCVITDLTMPGMDGWETIAALRKIKPDLSVILASGYNEDQAMSRDDSEQPNAFLHKPYSKEELKTALNRASEGKIKK